MAKWLPALLLLWLLPVGSTAQPGPGAAERPAETGSAGPGLPVRLAGEEVFRLYGEHANPEAVRIAEERVLRIAQDPFYSPDLITRQPAAEGVWLVYRGARIGLVEEQVAARLGLSAEQRASEVTDAIEQAVKRHHERQRPEEWTRAVLLLVLATALLAGAITLAVWLQRRLDAWLSARSQAGEVVAGHKLGFRSAARLAAFQQRLLRLGRNLAIALFAILYLQAAFAIVPITRGYAFGVVGYLLAPLRVVWSDVLASIGDLFFIVVIVALARLTLRALRGLMIETAFGFMTLPGIPQDRAVPLYKILRLAIIAITVVMIYPYIPGSSTAAFQGISLFAGALFTLGASSTASNFIGGVVLLFSGSFQVGDRVKIGDVVGDVEESTLALTRLRTPKNEVVTIANGNVLSQSFVNYSAMARKDGVIVHASLTLGYDAPWRKVHDLLVRAALKTEHVLEQPQPFVLQTSLNDFHVTYQINAYTREARWMGPILSELLENVQDAFAEAGVEILSPAYSALRDGAASTVPSYEASEGG